MGKNDGEIMWIIDLVIDSSVDLSRPGSHNYFVKGILSGTSL